MTPHQTVLARVASGNEIRVGGAGQYDWYTHGGAFMGRLTREEHHGARASLTLGHLRYDHASLRLLLTDAGRARAARKGAA